MFNCVEVRVDPAGDCDPEESWDFLQRADRAADPRVQEQVNVYTLSRPTRPCCPPLVLTCFILS